VPSGSSGADLVLCELENMFCRYGNVFISTNVH